MLDLVQRRRPTAPPAHEKQVLYLHSARTAIDSDVRGEFKCRISDAQRGGNPGEAVEPGPRRCWLRCRRGVLEELELGRALSEACEESGCDGRRRVRYAGESGGHMMIPSKRIEARLEQALTIRRPRRCRHSAANPEISPHGSPKFSGSSERKVEAGRGQSHKSMACFG